MDREDIIVMVIGLALVVILTSVILTTKYNCCMEVKRDHHECMYDVGCNS